MLSVIIVSTIICLNPSLSNQPRVMGYWAGRQSTRGSVLVGGQVGDGSWLTKA